VGAGYYVGNLPWVKEHFEAIIFLIIGISLLPMLFEYLSHRREKAASGKK